MHVAFQHAHGAASSVVSLLVVAFVLWRSSACCLGVSYQDGCAGGSLKDLVDALGCSSETYELAQQMRLRERILTLERRAFLVMLSAYRVRHALALR